MIRRLGFAALSAGAICLSVIVSACGSGGGQSGGNPTPMSEAAREMAALPQTHQAPIPRGLRCRGSIVWVNMSRKTYHEAGDPYYGRTKNGEYMCQAAANAAGYRMAGTARHANGGYNDNGGSMSGSRRHHRRSSGNYNGNGNGGYNDNGNGGYNNGNGNGGDTSGNGNGG